MALFRTPIAHTVAGYQELPLRVWDYGGTGPTLLFVHCTGTLGRIWDAVVAELNDAYRILAVDTRGQGDSAVPPSREDYQWAYSGHDLLRIVSHFDLGPDCGAVGHSAGGAHVAYTELLQPGTFPKVVLIDPIMGERAWFSGENPLAEKVRRRVNEFESRAAARERLSAKAPMALWVPDAVDAYMDHAFTGVGEGPVSLKTPGDREAWFYELGGACDVYEVLDTLGFDAALVTGSDSYVQPMIAAQAARMGIADVHTIPGAGHFIPQEKPRETAAVIDGHFGGHAGRTSTARPTEDT